MFRIKYGRGSTCGIALLKACTRGKLIVHIPDGRTGGDDKDDFQLDYDRVEDRITVICMMNTAYRTHRNRMYQHYSEKMEALQLQHESEGKPYTEVEIFAEVLGTKAGYVRGLGCSVRSIGSSSSNFVH
ncbi:hypothetical protein CJ030_MR2G016453 [Morella rubra]|uniref:Uncharacterized protein n=1 Tax=Morella rubra TaxID=262757 RepID=A0A6A1WCX9_9ROSI|nr:hypothetical protein CJ030_MR2G016453 [Morella rubra]